MPQRQLKGLIDGVTEQYGCDEGVLEVIETLAQHLTDEQISNTVRELAEREVVQPIEVKCHSWQRQVLLNQHGAVFINDTGKQLSASAGLYTVKDYDDLLRQCAERGFSHAGNMASDGVVSSADGLQHATTREAFVFELTFRSDGWHLLRGRPLVEGTYRCLTKALVNFDPYNNKLFEPSEL